MNLDKGYHEMIWNAYQNQPNHTHKKDKGYHEMIWNLLIVKSNVVKPSIKDIMRWFEIHTPQTLTKPTQDKGYHEMIWNQNPPHPPKPTPTDKGYHEMIWNGTSENLTNPEYW